MSSFLDSIRLSFIRPRDFTEYSASILKVWREMFPTCSDCLDNKRENYQTLFCAVLCTAVCTHTYEQFLQVSVGLGLVFVYLLRFSILCFFLV